MARWGWRGGLRRRRRLRCAGGDGQGMMEATPQQSNPRLPPETRPGFSGDGSARGGTFEDAGALRLRLGAYLSEQVGTKVAVDRLVKFPAGFSWITYGV